MKKYYITWGILGLLFVTSFIALWLNKLSLPPTRTGYQPVEQPTVAGTIVLIVAAGLIIAAIAALIIYQIYRRVHKK